MSAERRSARGRTYLSFSVSAAVTLISRGRGGRCDKGEDAGRTNVPRHGCDWGTCSSGGGTRVSRCVGKRNIGGAGGECSGRAEEPRRLLWGVSHAYISSRTRYKGRGRARRSPFGKLLAGGKVPLHVDARGHRRGVAGAECDGASVAVLVVASRRGIVMASSVDRAGMRP